MVASLEEIARHVNWYSEPARLMANTDLFLCQVMARGSLEDIITVQRQYSLQDFQKAYLHAPPGLFSRRAWTYWGLMLDHTELQLPERFPGANLLDWRKSN
jgi:hypothetical protein